MSPVSLANRAPHQSKNVSFHLLSAECSAAMFAYVLWHAIYLIYVLVYENLR
jgi:hypothetical protein